MEGCVQHTVWSLASQAVVTVQRLQGYECQRPAPASEQPDFPELMTLKGKVGVMGGMALTGRKHQLPRFLLSNLLWFESEICFSCRHMF